MNLLNNNANIDLKSRTANALRDLEVEIKAMYSLRNRIQSNVDESFDAVDNAEKDELVDLLNMTRSVERILHDLHIKLDTIRYLQEFIAILERAVLTLNLIRGDITRVLPLIDTALKNINDTFLEVKADLNLDLYEDASFELPLLTTNIELPLVEDKELIKLVTNVEKKGNKESDLHYRREVLSI